MNVGARCHAQALTESFELVLLGSVIALFADTGWVVHDIVNNEFNWQYGLIAGGLISATVITMIAFVKHHRVNHKKISKELLVAKLVKQKHKDRRRCKRG